MAPKTVRRLKKKPGCHTASTSDTEELSYKEQIRHLFNEKDKLCTLVRSRDATIATLNARLDEMGAQIVSLTASSQSVADELHTTKGKLFESLNANTLLRNDIKLAQKCIQKETGDDGLCLAQLAASPSTWRGRAQQIAHLQTRLAELKSQSEALMPETDAKVQQLRRIDAQRKQEIDVLHRQIAETKLEADELRTKLSAQRVRNKNLQDEVAAMKARCVSLNEKSDQDDGRVSKLNAEIVQLHEQLNGRVQQFQSQCLAYERSAADGRSEQQRMQNTINELLGGQATDQSTIAALRQQTADIESELKSVCGDFLFSCRDLRKDEYMSILDVLQGEKDSLLAQVEVMNGRLRGERERVAGLQETMRRHNVKFSRLEFKYNECLKDQSNLRDRNRRTQRISEYVKCLTPAASTSTVQLDEKRAVTSIGSTVDLASEQFQLQFTISELKNKLDLANEHNRMLDDRIAELTQEKCKDAELYRNIIARSKTLLVDNLHERKRLQQPSSLALELTPDLASTAVSTARTSASMLARNEGGGDTARQ